MNVSAAVLAITLCLEAQQHHSSLAEEIPTVPFALGFFPGPPSQHTFPHVCSMCFNSACPLSITQQQHQLQQVHLFPWPSASHMPQSVLPGSVFLSRGKRQAFQAKENSWYGCRVIGDG